MSDDRRKDVDPPHDAHSGERKPHRTDQSDIAGVERVAPTERGERHVEPGDRMPGISARMTRSGVREQDESEERAKDGRGRFV